MNTKLVVPPMPEVWALRIEGGVEGGVKTTERAIHALQTYARTGWHTAQREAALADEMAEALEDQECRCHFEPVEGNWAVVPPVCRRCVALSKHKEARNG